jgi:ABC-type Fe3+/spermidine/putrescine transport system ATPase subunit
VTCIADGDACPPAGARVLMMIRPEKIAIAPPDARARSEAHGAPVNRLSATVQTNVYCGNRRELGVATRDFEVRVSAPNTVAARKGATVELEFSARDLCLLPQGRVQPG